MTGPAQTMACCSSIRDGALVTRALRADAGDRGEQFACDIAGEPRQMFVAKMDDQVIAYGRVVKLAADEAARGLRLVTISAAC